MCLDPTFFDDREARILEREARGDLELEHFLERRQGSLDRLYRLGLLRDDRECMSTADLFMHQLTALGRRFMEREGDHQLIFVRREGAAALDALLDQAGGQKP